MLSDEEKKAIEKIRSFNQYNWEMNNLKEKEFAKPYFDALDTILNLIKKQSKEIEKRANQRNELAILNAKQIEFNKLVNTVNSYKGQFKRQQKEIEELKETLKCTQNSWFEDTQKIEEMKKQIDLDNECEIALNNKIMDLEKEIEELKNITKSYDSFLGDEKIVIADKKFFVNGYFQENFVRKDKIKAKIEPVLKQLERKMEEEYNKYGNSREYQDVVDAYNFLQSLLEKE